MNKEQRKHFGYYANELCDLYVPVKNRTDCNCGETKSATHRRGCRVFHKMFELPDAVNAYDKQRRTMSIVRQLADLREMIEEEETFISDLEGDVTGELSKTDLGRIEVSKRHIQILEEVCETLEDTERAADILLKR